MAKKKENYWSLIWIMAKTDFKLRYHGSILGYIWVLLKPLLIFLVLNFVFVNVFGDSVEHYSVTLLLAIILWNFFAEGTITGLSSLMNKASIITKVYVPKWIIVISSTLNVLIAFAINLLILSFFFAFYGVIPGALSLLVFFGLCLMIYLMIVIFSFLFSSYYLKLRDLNQVWEVLLTAGFYAAPIIYPIEYIPEGLRYFLYFNPMTFVIQWSKELLLMNSFPPFLTYSLLVLALVFLTVLSYFLFRRSSMRAVESL